MIPLFTGGTRCTRSTTSSSRTTSPLRRPRPSLTTVMCRAAKLLISSNLPWQSPARFIIIVARLDICVMPPWIRQLLCSALRNTRLLLPYFNCRPQPLCFFKLPPASMNRRRSDLGPLVEQGLGALGARARRHLEWAGRLRLAAAGDAVRQWRHLYRKRHGRQRLYEADLPRPLQPQRHRRGLPHRQRPWPPVHPERGSPSRCDW